ncbi:hypothetical protein Adt_19449 [Abeliophyllum distichum]|uniref:Uncharacterized protein n=1 Tax=Abeliophyllum distichum TaxID=126358 RepID=A0ABD1SVC4_9LAMI
MVKGRIRMKRKLIGHPVKWAMGKQGLLVGNGMNDDRIILHRKRTKDIHSTQLQNSYQTIHQNQQHQFLKLRARSASTTNLQQYRLSLHSYSHDLMCCNTMQLISA